ncbi:MAG: pseudouridine-5'-phosphate glycosidase [Spirochaetales bacterium]|nr:pseudouridine-5'-phosphate glycosidase [Spirochaetales bacterium]
MGQKSTYIEVGPEVGDAIADGAAVVALESTIISHGMPYPKNIETAREVEAVVRAAGAVPATIAVMDGRFRIGLSAEELEVLAKSADVLKASRRDLGVAFARKLTAATTVATTMIGAAWAGIRVFATGGTGGVHRGVEQTMDVSADLQELARTGVAVVSAGVKSILDIPRTLEYLETMGVPVLGFETREFPAFFSRESGSQVAHRVESAADAAGIMAAHWNSGLGSGLLLANPIPAESAMDPDYIEGVIARAVADAEAAGVVGKDITPYLLARIVELTDGKSLEANIALVKNNARVAAEVASALAETPRLRSPANRVRSPE